MYKELSNIHLHRVFNLTVVILNITYIDQFLLI